MPALLKGQLRQLDLGLDGSSALLFLSCCLLLAGNILTNTVVLGCRL